MEPAGGQSNSRIKGCYDRIEGGVRRLHLGLDRADIAGVLVDICRAGKRDHHTGRGSGVIRGLADAKAGGDLLQGDRKSLLTLLHRVLHVGNHVHYAHLDPFSQRLAALLHSCSRYSSSRS